MKRLVTWADLNYTHEPGPCPFQDGILELTEEHFAAWDRDLEGVWEVTRHPTKPGHWLPAVFHPSEDGPDEG